MPIYEYRCAACGHDLEALQKMADAPLRKCPECGKSQLKRLVSAPQFRLKGSGWYETDFKDKNEKKRNLVEKGGDGGDSAGDTSTDTSAKEAAGKEVAAAKGDSAAAKPAKRKPKPAPAPRSKPAAKPRAKAARG